MSNCTNGTDLSKVIVNRRNRGMVRSLILEFEKLEVNKFKRMGAEHSATPKSSSTNLIKEKVNQLDRNTGTLPDKKKRHKSITEENDRLNNSKEFQRSKSLDCRKIRDGYQRSRQVSPKPNGNSHKLHMPPRKIITETNNNAQKEDKIKKITKPVDPVDTKIDRRTQQTETSSSAAKGRESKTDSTAKLNKKPETRLYTRNKKMKSAKSIKKRFENVEQNGCYATTPNVSTSDKNDTTNNVSGENKLDPVKYTVSDKTLSQSESNISQIVDDSTVQNCIEDNKKKSSESDSALDDFRKSIWNEITNDFYTENEDDVQVNYDEDEYDKIKNTFQEMEKDIEEMKERFGEVASENNKAPKDSENMETIDIYLAKRSFSENLDEDEFGQRSFGSFENINYTEAYNRMGDELIETSVACIRHRTLSEYLYGSEPLLTNIYEKNSKPLSDAKSIDFLPAENEFTTKQDTKLSEGASSLELWLSDTENENNYTDLMNTVGLVEACNSYECLSIPNSEKADENLDLNQESDTVIENPIYFAPQDLKEFTEDDKRSSIPSNRSTIYSSTYTNSTDSISRLGEEGKEIDIDTNDKEVAEDNRISEDQVEIRQHTNDGFERTIKTETIYDSFQNPRIAKVSNINPSHNISNKDVYMNTPNGGEIPKSPTTNSKPKIEFIIEELIETEMKYLKQLETIILDYMPELTDEKLPSSLKGKSRYIFGNIKRIYNGTQKFYTALKYCDNNYEGIAETFLVFKQLFELYPLYSKNKPIADHYLLGDFKDLITTREKQLNDRLGLASNLLTPIQRLGKYILFLEQIQKELFKKGCPSDNIYKAIETVRKQMSRGNDYIAIDSIRESPINLIEEGSFLMREKFNVIKPRKYESMLFLFEKILVFTTVDTRNSEIFIYRDSIKLNEMGIVTFDDQPLIFHLKRFSSRKMGLKENNKFVIEAKRSKDKRIWTEEIERLLWEQLVKCRDEQRQLRSRPGKKNSTGRVSSNSKKDDPRYSSLPGDNKRRSIFYVETDA